MVATRLKVWVAGDGPGVQTMPIFGGFGGQRTGRARAASSATPSGEREDQAEPSSSHRHRGLPSAARGLSRPRHRSGSRSVWAGSGFWYTRTSVIMPPGPGAPLFESLPPVAVLEVVDVVAAPAVRCRRAARRCRPARRRARRAPRRARGTACSSSTRCPTLPLRSSEASWPTTCIGMPGSCMACCW